MKLSRAMAPTFQASLKKLLRAPLPLSVMFKLKKIVAKIDGEITTYYQVKNEALSKIVEIDEKGRYKMNEKEELVFKSEQDKASFIEEHSKLFEVSFELPCKLKAQDLGTSVDKVLDTIDVMQLEDILEE